MITISKDAFSISRFDSLIANGTQRKAVNLLANPGFEEGAFSPAGHAGTGTVTQTGTAVTGSGTLFLTQVTVGNVIIGVGVGGTVTAIADDTHLTSDLNYAGTPYTITPPGTAGTGTVIQVGTALTGIGTHFTTEAAIGRTIAGAGVSGNVVSITDNTHLTLNTNYGGASYTITPVAWNQTSWQIISATSVNPNASGNWAAQAASTFKGQGSILKSVRVAVSGAGDYLASIFFSSPDGAPKRANHLSVTVQWWNVASGGLFLREDTVWASPVKPNQRGMHHAQLRLSAPVGATYASFVIGNIYGSATAGYGVIVDKAFLSGFLTISRLSALDIWQSEGGAIRFRNLKYSWNDQYGCKQLEFRIYGPTEYLWSLMQTALGDHVETHYEGERVFAGMLWTMKGRVGKRDMSISLDSLANFVKVPYGGTGTGSSTNTFYAAADAESMLQYGRKDLYSDKSFDTEADARSFAAYLLEGHAFPIPTAEEPFGDAPDYLDILVNGYFATTQWLTDVPPLYVGSHDTSEVAATMARTVYGGRSLLDRAREETPNDFISGDYSLVKGLSQPILPLTATARLTSQDILLGLLLLGSGSRQRVIAGVNADRLFYMKKRPTALRYYRERDADGRMSYWDSDGNEVPRPLVKCGEFVTEGHPTPNFFVTPNSDAARDPANRYIVEAQYDHEANEVHLQFVGARRFDVDLGRALRATRALKIPV